MIKVFQNYMKGKGSDWYGSENKASVRFNRDLHEGFDSTRNFDQSIDKLHPKFRDNPINTLPL